MFARVEARLREHAQTMTATRSALRILLASFVLLALVGMPAAAVDTTAPAASGDAPASVDVDSPTQMEDAFAATDCYYVFDEEGRLVAIICVE